MLVVRKRRAFTGRPDRNKAIGAFRDLPVDEFPKGFFVHGAILEGRHQGGE
jgi:hypothetical protein